MMFFSRLVSRRLALAAQHQTPQHLPHQSSALLPLFNRFLNSPDVFKTLGAPCTSLRTYATRGRPKSSPKKTASKSKPKAKKQPAKKAKPAKKPKTKTKARKATKKTKTPGATVAAKVSSLRKVALLDTPKKRPATVWFIYYQQHVVKGEGLTSQAKEIARGYRNLSPSERESLNQTAINNRLLDQRTYTDWIRSHTPDQIRLANNARMRLNRLSAQRHGKSNQRVTRRFPLLRDDRQLKRPVSGYIQFVADRWATGEFKNTTPAAAASQISRDWKALSESERKKYNDEALLRKEQYLTEQAELYPSIAEKRNAARARSSSSVTVGR